MRRDTEIKTEPKKPSYLEDVKRTTAITLESFGFMAAPALLINLLYVTYLHIKNKWN